MSYAGTFHQVRLAKYDLTIRLLTIPTRVLNQRACGILRVDEICYDIERDACAFSRCLGFADQEVEDFDTTFI
jgi:hypothetical protein